MKDFYECLKASAKIQNLLDQYWSNQTEETRAALEQGITEEIARILADVLI